MPKLTDAQLVILSAAAQRDDATALPLPPTLKLNKGAATTVLTSLVKRSLLAERPAGTADVLWRESDDGHHLTLAITAAGLEAIGVEPDNDHANIPTLEPDGTPAPAGAIAGSSATTPVTAAAVRPGTKQSLLVDLLRRDGGATVDEIGQATGWQAHSIRGAISGTLKKKLGLTIASETVDGRGRVYRITAGT